MKAPIFPQLASCEECGQAVTSRRRWCSGRCKLRAWLREHPDRKYTRERVCLTCQQVFTSVGKTYCSETCKIKAKTPKPKQHITRICVECSQVFTAHARTSKQVTCSLTCRRARLRTLLKGKKYRPWKVHELTCADCQRAFTSSHKTTPICERCLRRKHARLYGHGRPERRAKKAGVPYVYGIKPEQVFARDGWRCQLCGCKTPQHLRGKNQPRSPEVDHIVPLSQGGGHTWDNVQCACRKCNIQKAAHVRGQLRLAI
jgi:hypothetical protein